MRFGIFIYDGVEPIDLATFGVLSMARRIAPEIEICTIAPRAGPVALANGLKVTADFGIDDAPSCDLVIVTGGPGWTTQAADAGDARLYSSRSRIGSHRLGVHRRHDTGRERCARWRACDHQTRGGAAGNVAARGDARQLSRRSTCVRPCWWTEGEARDRRRRLALHRHHAPSARHHARPDVADETARIMEYQRAWRANREGFAPVLAPAPGRELIKGGWSHCSSGNGPFAGDQISAQNELVRSRPS